MSEELFVVLFITTVALVTFGLHYWTKYKWAPYIFFFIIGNTGFYIDYYLDPEAWEGWFYIGWFFFNVYMFAGTAIGTALWFVTLIRKSDK
ncbi:MAG: hypothetical protein P8H03_00920 [Emcibacteraceae bacterium]|nr:hypothetical protein [Emcibacteraceae bacterium]